MSAPLTVVSIVGMTRSGSTLLDQILGQADNYFSAGELHYLFDRGLLKARHCSCGLPLHGCPIWGQVLSRLQDQGALDDPEWIVRWQETHLRLRHMGKLRSALRDPAAQDSDRYRTLMTSLYRTISEVTGARIIVDSSKRATDALISSSLEGITAVGVHLLRDPRAVAYSWAQIKMDRHHDVPVPMPVMGPVEASRSWISMNLAAERLERQAIIPMYRIRYEDLVKDPIRRLEELESELGLGSTEWAEIVRNNSVEMLPGHMVGGNPIRFNSGTISIKEDERWKASMQRRSRLLVTVITAPFLGRFGYEVVP